MKTQKPLPNPPTQYEAEYMYDLSSEEAIRLTNKYHNNRTIMRDKWRKIGSPQTDKQKEFVTRMFKPVFINGITVKNSFYFLSNNSRHSVVYNGTVYKNTNICYYANTYPEKARELMCCANFHDFNRIVNTIENTCDNKDKREELLTNVLSYKLQTYNDVYGVLKKTFLRPITYVEDGIDELLRVYKVLNFVDQRYKNIGFPEIN